MRKALVTLCFGFVQLLALKGQIVIDTASMSKAEITDQATINTSNLEFSPFFYRDYIGFCYTPTSGDKDDEINEYFFDLCFSAEDIKGNLAKRADFVETINSEFHEGPAAFNPINGMLYFTRSWYDKKRGTNRDTIVRKIYQSNSNGGFSKVSLVSISDEKYHSCHPTLSENGSTMIFSSNRPGSSKMDLYTTNLTNGLWSEPQNLGVSINSEANEVFPFLYRDSILFFSADKAEGNGGLDIYCSFNRDNTWTTPIILPSPFNSTFDDFGIIVTKDGRSGYMTSNRPGGKGKDDIYKFVCSTSILKAQAINIYADYHFTSLDKLSFEPIPGATITLTPLILSNELDIDQYDINLLGEENNGEIVVKLSPKKDKSLPPMITDSNGDVVFSLKKGKKYILTCSAPNHQNTNLLIDTKKSDAQFNIVMNPIETKVEEDTAINNQIADIVIPTKKGEVVVFNNIYYDYNSDLLLSGAVAELDALLKTMNEQPSMKVQLSAHTDSRGTTIYNQDLSMRRANSAKQYLVSRGIESSRIFAVGFGESRIRNHCTDTVTCTEAEHMFNRRTEVTVLEN